jgi:hypothetical protein
MKCPVCNGAGEVDDKLFPMSQAGFGITEPSRQWPHRRWVFMPHVDPCPKGGECDTRTCTYRACQDRSFDKDNYSIEQDA